jgi:hypothetical protein
MSNSSDSVFVINDHLSAKILQGNHPIYDLIDAFSQYIVKDHEKEYNYTLNNKLVNIIELELKINSFEFVDKVKNESNYFEMKIVPSHFMRSIIIRKINELTPLVDLYYALKNITTDIKKIISLDDLSIPGLNQKSCVVEYQTHQAAKNALKILSNITNNIHNPYYKILSYNNLFFVEAVWCEPCVDNVKDYLKNTPFFFFENLNINNYSVFHFKSFLENYFFKNNEKVYIKKIRQFFHKVLVEFDRTPKILENDKYLEYNGRFLPICKAMKPGCNLQKYKDKNVKISAYSLSEEDKKNLLSRFKDTQTYTSDVYKKKADYAYLKIVNDEKQLVPQFKDKEGSFLHKRERDENHWNRDRSRDKDYLIDSEYKERKRDDGKKLSHSYDDYKKKSTADKKEIEDKFSNVNGSNQNVNTSKAMNQNLLGQLTNLLLNNPNQNVLSSLQNINALSSLASLNTLLNNPSILTLLQQLTNNPLAAQLLTNPTLQSSIPNIQGNANNLTTNTNKNIIPQNIQYAMNANQNIPSNQINSMYNLPFNSSDSITTTNSQGYFNNPSNSQPQSHLMNNPSNINKTGFYPNMTPGSGFYPSGGEIPMSVYMPPGMYSGNINSMEFHDQSHQQSGDADMMKKYYEYYQNLNK